MLKIASVVFLVGRIYGKLVSFSFSRSKKSEKGKVYDNGSLIAVEYKKRRDKPSPPPEVLLNSKVHLLAIHFFECALSLLFSHLCGDGGYAGVGGALYALRRAVCVAFGQFCRNALYCE